MTTAEIRNSQIWMTPEFVEAVALDLDAVWRANAQRAGWRALGDGVPRRETHVDPRTGERAVRFVGAVVALDVPADVAAKIHLDGAPTPHTPDPSHPVDITQTDALEAARGGRAHSLEGGLGVGRGLLGRYGRG